MSLMVQQTTSTQAQVAIPVKAALKATRDALRSCSRLSLCGNEIRVKRHLPDKYVEELGDYIVGEAAGDQQEIRLFEILDDYAEQRQAQTFLHEFFHMALNYYGHLDKYDDELLVDNLASAVLELLSSLR